MQNLTCSKFKHHKTILMLCNKIEISESERFTQTIEKKNELERFMKARMSILIFVFLSESYIQRKTFRRQRYTDLHRLQKFHIILAGKKETLKKIKRINMNIVKTYMNNIKIRGFIEICSNEKLSAEEVTYFLVSFLESMFSC